jgi:hypothetical protein
MRVAADHAITKARRQVVPVVRVADVQREALEQFNFELTHAMAVAALKERLAVRGQIPTDAGGE